MNADELRELVRRESFAPFKIHLTDGRTFEVRHPSEIIVSLVRVVVGLPPSRKATREEIARITQLKICDIDRVEMLL